MRVESCFLACNVASEMDRANRTKEDVLEKEQAG